MKSWRSTLCFLAWIGWLSASWCSAQVTPDIALPGATVTWGIPGFTFPLTPVEGFVGGQKAKMTKLDSTHVSVVIPSDTMEGVVPLRVKGGDGKVYQGEIVVEGQDAQINATSGEVTVQWIDCPQDKDSPTSTKAQIAASLDQFAPRLSRETGVISTRVVDVRTFPLNGPTVGGSCGCQAVEVDFRLIFETADHATAIGQWLAVLGTAPFLTANHSTPDTRPEPLISRSPAIHGLYHVGPDHVPLFPQADLPIRSFQATELKVPTQGPKRVLVAVLDTGFSNSIKADAQIKSLLQVSAPLTGPLTYSYKDGFDVNEDFTNVLNSAGKLIEHPRTALNQGTGHGTPVVALISEIAQSIADVWPIRVCDQQDKDGRPWVCRDTQIMQGLCVAAQYYKLHQAQYPGGLIFNLSLGSLTPSFNLRALLNDIFEQLDKDGPRPWVIAAAGNLIPDKTKRELMNPEAKSGKPLLPQYFPSTSQDWETFKAKSRYVMAFPAGYGVTSSDLSSPLFPALQNIVGVGSLEHRQSGDSWVLADTSLRGRHVRLCAPGRNVWSRDEMGNPARYSGTSFAAPVVSGVLADLLSTKPELTWTDLTNRLPPPLSTAQTSDSYCK